ncbi:MAG: DUF4235 domain-containing protein [Actinomycetota bacterium]
MAKNDDETQKPSAVQSMGAVLAGVIAVRLATYVVTTAWRLITREDPPQVDEEAPVGKKAAWIALSAAAAGVARQTARDLVKPPSASGA